MAVLKISLSMGVVIGLLGIPGHTATAQQDPAGTATALRVFEERVSDYMDLRHRLERSLPPVEPSATIEPILARSAALASAIETARPHAVQENIFTAEVAGWFRHVIARALDGVDAEELLADLYAEDWAPSNFHPRVHDHYPAWATHEMPPVLLAHLPNLPAGLRYQLIDHDLVLWDVDADLIVDFVEDAIVRRGGNTIVARDGSPCRSGVAPARVDFRKKTGKFPTPSALTTTRIDRHGAGRACSEPFGIGERIASCAGVMSAESFRQDLFALAPHSAVMHAISFVRLALISARRTLCAVRGHDMFLHFEPERLSLRCVACGAETQGWRMDVDPRFRGRQRRLTALRQRDKTLTGEPMLNRVRQGTGSDSTAPRAA